MDKASAVSAAIIITMITGFLIIGVIEPTHYCEDRQIKAHCYSLSSTNKTCYTVPENIGGKRCSSLWKEIPSVFYENSDAQNNIYIENEQNKEVKSWICAPDGCVSKYNELGE